MRRAGLIVIFAALLATFSSVVADVPPCNKTVVFEAPSIIEFETEDKTTFHDLGAEGHVHMSEVIGAMEGHFFEGLSTRFGIGVREFKNNNLRLVVGEMNARFHRPLFVTHFKVKSRVQRFDERHFTVKVNITTHSKDVAEGTFMVFCVDAGYRSVPCPEFLRDLFYPPDTAAIDGAGI